MSYYLLISYTIGHTPQKDNGIISTVESPLNISVDQGIQLLLGTSPPTHYSSWRQLQHSQSVISGSLKNQHQFANPLLSVPPSEVQGYGSYCSSYSSRSGTMSRERSAHSLASTHSRSSLTHSITAQNQIPGELHLSHSGSSVCGSSRGLCSSYESSFALKPLYKNKKHSQSFTGGSPSVSHRQPVERVLSAPPYNHHNHHLTEAVSYDDEDPPGREMEIICAHCMHKVTVGDTQQIDSVEGVKLRNKHIKDYMETQRHSCVSDTTPRQSFSMDTNRSQRCLAPSDVAITRHSFAADATPVDVTNPKLLKYKNGRYRG